MTAQDEYRDIVTNSAYNLFPEPQTIPFGWDISALLSTPKVDPVSDSTESVEDDS